jgi:hypothetical protein
MEEPMINIKPRVVATGVLAASLSLVSVAAPANAAVRTILDIGPGSLVAKGAMVDLPVTFICDQGSFNTSLTVQLQQNASQQRTATGSGVESGFVCTGKTQTVTLTIKGPRRAPAIAFKNGTASVQVSLTTCAPDSTCGSESLSKEVMLKNN